MRIAVDVMGGDQGCRAIIEGIQAALAGDRQITELYLVGREEEIKAALQQLQFQDPRLRIHHASEVLTMEDKPLSGFRRKKDCSISRAMELVRDQRADAVISSGNTGGLVAAATFILGRLDGIERPALAAIMPTIGGHFVMVDVGATPECKPLHLLQFAIMGSIYSRFMLGRENPRVGLLSNGSEEFKGTDLTREAAQLVKESQLNYVGYVEGTQVFADAVDVVVVDGFVGNIVLKNSEGLGKAILKILKTELMANPLRKFGAWIARGAFYTLRKRTDPDAHGGAPLLGLNGFVVKIHGSAGPKVVANAVRQTAEAIHHQIGRRIREEIAEAARRVVPAAPASPANRVTA